MPFKSGKQLTPSEVYYSVLGAYKKAEWTCERQLYDSYENEIARVYVKSGITHIVHFPGKDNSLQPTPTNPTMSLQDIVDNVEHQIKDIKDTEKLCKKYIVAQSNKISGFAVRHYVYAEINEDNTLHIIDSVHKRGYDFGPTLDILHEKGEFKITHTKHQDWVFQHWQCGHHVIAEFCHQLGLMPLSSKITEKVIEQHQDLYNAICNPRESLENDGCSKQKTRDSAIDDFIDDFEGISDIDSEAETSLFEETSDIVDENLIESDADEWNKSLPYSQLVSSFFHQMISRKQTVELPEVDTPGLKI